MRTISTALVVSTLIFGSPVFAGGGHEHGPDGSHSYGLLTAASAVNMAEKQVKALVERGKLDKSWTGIKASEANQKDFGKGPEWVVSFKNENAEAGKQTLYVFYTVTGSYLATNFTGK
jgi:hypothetical protein